MLSTLTLNVMWISFFPTGIRTVCPLSTPARQHQSMSEVNLHFHHIIEQLSPRFMAQPETHTVSQCLSLTPLSLTCGYRHGDGLSLFGLSRAATHHAGRGHDGAPPTTASTRRAHHEGTGVYRLLQGAAQRPTLR